MAIPTADAADTPQLQLSQLLQPTPPAPAWQISPSQWFWLAGGHRCLSASLFTLRGCGVLSEVWSLALLLRPCEKVSSLVWSHQQLLQAWAPDDVCACVQRGGVLNVNSSGAAHIVGRAQPREGVAAPQTS